VSAAGVAPAASRALVVCTGNICRSPAAALLLRAGLGERSGVEVASAGLHAVVGEPVAEPVARRLRGLGIDAAGFRARQLQPSDLRGADVVLTMTSAQRSAVVGSLPAAVRRTFTLREFARLAALADVDPSAVEPGERLAAVVRAAPRARARYLPAPGEDDVEDPYRRSDEVHAEVFAAIGTAVRDLLAVLRPPGPADAAPVTDGDRSSAGIPGSSVRGMTGSDRR
jgi:protein-tyrosine phosphatase